MNDFDFCSYSSYDDVRSEFETSRFELRKKEYRRLLTQMSNEMIADLLEQTIKNSVKFSRDNINAVNDEAVSRLRGKK